MSSKNLLGELSPEGVGRCHSGDQQQDGLEDRHRVAGFVFSLRGERGKATQLARFQGCNPAANPIDAIRVEYVALRVRSSMIRKVLWFPLWLGHEKPMHSGQVLAGDVDTPGTYALKNPAATITRLADTD